MRSDKPSERLTWSAWALARCLCVTFFLLSPPTQALKPKLFVPFIDDPAGLATIEYPDTSDWRFFRTSSYCYAYVVGDEGRLSIGYSRPHDEFHISFWSGKRNPDYKSHSRADVQIVSAAALPDGRLGDPIGWDDTWAALVVDNDTNQQTFNIKVDRPSAVRLLAGAGLISFVGLDGEFLASFGPMASSAAIKRLLTCNPS